MSCGIFQQDRDSIKKRKEGVLNDGYIIMRLFSYLFSLQAILKRISSKEPHYNHLQWVRMCFLSSTTLKNINILSSNKILLIAQ